MAARDSRAAGFSLIEVLVAIAIVAGLIVGIGSLLTNVASFGTRAGDANRIMNALIEINALRSLIEAEIAVVASQPLTAGFTLNAAADVQRPIPPARLAIGSNLQPAVMEFSRGDTFAAVDLSAFEAISLEYFVPSTQASFWQAAPSSDSEVVGTRLVLRQGARVWRPLIWMQSEYRR